jgi:hypothetical protein
MFGEAIESRASSVRPLLQGDRIGNREVRGFAWIAPIDERRSNHQDDRLLLDGDELLPLPPDRYVPQSSEFAVADAPIPPEDLVPGRTRKAATIAPSIPVEVEAVLDRTGAAWRPVMRPLLAAIHSTGHRAWLSGGAVRDALSGAPAAEVKDVDMSGTVPPGRFSDISYQALRATGMPEARITICPQDLVCSIMVGPATTVVEYRGLSLGGFRYPAVGSRLVEDAWHRDFSFNSLLYDVLEHEVFDPLGYGLEDLRGGVRRFVPLKLTGEPRQMAAVVVRAMKFALRWENDTQLDLEPLRRRLEDLTVDFWQGLAQDDWESLRSEHASVNASLDRQRRFASELPEAAQFLIASLIGGT